MIVIALRASQVGVTAMMKVAPMIVHGMSPNLQTRTKTWMRKNVVESECRSG